MSENLDDLDREIDEETAACIADIRKYGVYSRRRLIAAAKMADATIVFGDAISKITMDQFTERENNPDYCAIRSAAADAEIQYRAIVAAEEKGGAA